MLISPKNTTSLLEEDIILLLNSIGDTENPEFLQKKEKLPDEALVESFKELTDYSLESTSAAIIETANKIQNQINTQYVLVSLPRGGTHAGIGIKYVLKQNFGQDVSHYSISMLKGVGIDAYALDYVIQKHQNPFIVFVDGWVGKGELAHELRRAIADYEKSKQTSLQHLCAVISDPYETANISGTHAELFMPESLMGATISGLVSRSGNLHDLSYHFTREYTEWQAQDFTNWYIQRVKDAIDKNPLYVFHTPLDFEQVTSYIHSHHGLESKDAYFGAAEVHRSIVRKHPSKIILRDKNHPLASPLLISAAQKNIPIVEDVNLPLFSVASKK
tara:strand:+ start:6778 stop:7773 length:996 start_codon:yes stop_codon:yes gene_type:complete